jgi:hypothetical protein
MSILSTKLPKQAEQFFSAPRPPSKLINYPVFEAPVYARGILVETPPKSAPVQTSMKIPTHRVKWTAKDYLLLIKMWILTGNVLYAAKVTGMPIKTARNIITQYKQTGRTASKLRGVSQEI